MMKSVFFFVYNYLGKAAVIVMFFLLIRWIIYRKKYGEDNLKTQSIGRAFDVTKWIICMLIFFKLVISHS